MVAVDSAAVAESGAFTLPSPVGRWEAFRRFCRAHPRIPIFTGVMLLLIVPCVFAPLLAPYDPRAPNTSARLQGPSRQHLLGTDHLGRDTLSRMLYGGRVTIPVGLTAVAVSIAIGVLLGIVAGFYGGIVDQLLGRWVDAQLAFPELILIIAIVNAFGQDLWKIMIIVGFSRFPTYFRLARGQVLQAREFDYVSAARALGASRSRQMFRHVLPNILNPLIISTSFAAGGAVLTLASLGFLGLGPAAGQPDWGAMFNEALVSIRVQPWLVFGPGLAVFLTVLSFYMLGDALRDALDPRRRARA